MRNVTGLVSIVFTTSLLTTLAACGSPQKAPEGKATQSAKVIPKKDTVPNSGGMWMPRQLAKHSQHLKELGLKIPAEELADPKKTPLGAAVSLGGCSASFVSPKGLIVTNHHCVTRILQYSSTPKKNYLRDGYAAAKADEELWAGPTQKAYVVDKITDITKQLRDGLAEIKDPKERYAELENREKQAVSACEKGRPDFRCNIASFFGGREFHLIERIQLRDIRLVYAPPEGVGNYGGDVDNWMWPRHTGDFSFLRAYVGPDGKPAEHSEKNVPYKPSHFLKTSINGVKKDSLVFVMGYPGRTSRLASAQSAKDSIEWRFPRFIKLADEYLATIDKVTEGNEKRRLIATPTIRGLNNYKKKFEGMLEGIEKGDLVKNKEHREADMLAAVAEHPEWKSTGEAVAKISSLEKAASAFREQDGALSEIARYSTLLAVADTIVHMAAERNLPDEKRDPSMQKRNWDRIEGYFNSLDKRYDRELDKAMLATAIRRSLRLDDNKRPKVVSQFLKNGTTDSAVEKTLTKMYKSTSLENPKTRIKLFRKATTEQLHKSKDPLVQVALVLRGERQEAEDRDEAFAGEMLIYRPEYIRGLERSGELVAPDANSTLRVTYGTVLGYAPSQGAKVYQPFTYATEILPKHTGKYPFDAPKKLVDAIQAKNYGPYAEADDDGAGLPVDFLATTDITNGNSGSPTLNARGELVGLAFDGNYEAMASDWIFMPDLTRTISTDIRYALFVLDVLGGDAVLEELGFTPAID